MVRLMLAGSQEANRINWHSSRKYQAKWNIGNEPNEKPVEHRILLGASETKRTKLLSTHTAAQRRNRTEFQPKMTRNGGTRLPYTSWMPGLYKPSVFAISAPFSCGSLSPATNPNKSNPKQIKSVALFRYILADSPQSHTRTHYLLRYFACCIEREKCFRVICLSLRLICTLVYSLVHFLFIHKTFSALVIPANDKSISHSFFFTFSHNLSLICMGAFSSTFCLNTQFLHSSLTYINWTQTIGTLGPREWFVMVLALTNRNRCTWLRLSISRIHIQCFGFTCRLKI